MFSIKNLNELFKNITNYFKGESYIQSGVNFEIVLKQSHICKFVENSEHISFFINDLESYSIPYSSLEGKNFDITVFSFWEFLLSQFSYKENLEGKYLKNIYSGQIVIFSTDNKLYQVQYTNYNSDRTNKPFMFINRITELNDIQTEYILDDKLFLENNSNGKIEKYEFFVI